MKMTFFLIILNFILSCSNLKRSPSGSEVVSFTNCNIVLQKLTKAHGPILVDEDLQKAIQDLAQINIHFTPEEIFSMQWSQTTPIINDNLIAYFLRIELEKQSINPKKENEVIEFLQSLDSNQLLGIIRKISEKFKYGYILSPDIVALGEYEQLAKILQITPEQFKIHQRNLLFALKQNEYLADLSILLHLKNRQRLMAKLVKESHKLDSKQTILLLSLIDENDQKNISRLKTLEIDYTPEAVLRVYSQKSFYYYNEELFGFVKKFLATEVDYHFEGFPSRRIPKYGPTALTIPFLNKHYKKLNLNQLEDFIKLINIKVKNYPFLESHLEHLKYLQSKTDDINFHENRLLSEPDNQGLKDYIEKVKAERQDYFNKMDYLFE